MKGYIRKRGNTYSYTVDIGRDPVTGKRKQKTKGSFKTKKAAQEALNELIYEVNKGIYVLESKNTVEELSLEWYENNKHKWANTTADVNLRTVKKWIIPHFGYVKIQDLAPLHGHRFVKVLNENLASSTARKIFSLANQILYYAVDMELLSKNPFAKVSSPVDRTAEKTTWKFDEIKKFLSVSLVAQPFYHNVVTVAVFTGMRKGEIFGLRRQDVDFENGIITVRQSIHETSSHGIEIGGPKTKTSKRPIAVDDNVIKAIKSQISRNNELRMALGPNYHNHDLIFCKDDGEPYRPSSLNRPFNRLTKKAGVPQIRFHDLRHTHATLLLELGANPKLIAERLGHSNVKTTLNTYSHVTANMQLKAIQDFDAAFKAN